MTTAKDIIRNLKLAETRYDGPRWVLGDHARLIMRQGYGDTFIRSVGPYDVYIKPEDHVLAADWVLVEGNGTAHWNGNHLDQQQKSIVREALTTRYGTIFL